MYILICWSVAGRPGTSVLFLGEIPMLPAHTLRPEERVKPAPPVWPTYGWATPALRPTKPAIPRVAGRPTLLSRGIQAYRLAGTRLGTRFPDDVSRVKVPLNTKPKRFHHPISCFLLIFRRNLIYTNNRI